MDIQETIQFNLGATYNEGLEEGRRGGGIWAGIYR